MIDLRALYQDVILDHSKNPRNAGTLEPHSHAARGNNPLCGDKIEVFVDLDDDERIRDLRFEAKGCAISVASASMMTELVKGETVADAKAVFERFREIVTRKGEVAEDEIEALDKLAALIGVREFPMRVKCATLPWHTLAAALDETPRDVTTE